MILRDKLFTAEAKKADKIFINKNGEQVTLDTIEEAVKFLGGFAVMPKAIAQEIVEDHSAKHIIYTAGNVSVTLIQYKGGSN